VIIFRKIEEGLNYSYLGGSIYEIFGCCIIFDKSYKDLYINETKTNDPIRNETKRNPN